jgi:hypothetical protein
MRQNHEIMSAPTKPEINEERIFKAAEAIFFHFGKNKLSYEDTIVCLAGIVATTLEQSPVEVRPKLRAWFNAMIDPLAPKLPQIAEKVQEKLPQLTKDNLC